MTQGVLLIANNNSEIDYLKLASYTAKQVKQYLNVPVSLITDSTHLFFKNYARDAILFDKIIDCVDTDLNYKSFYDGDQLQSKTSWKNGTRSSCFDLTPYDETLVIDVDYVINSDNLSHCFNQPHDFLIYRRSADLSVLRSKIEFDLVSNTSIPFYWATVFYFKKTAATDNLFTLINNIKDNWHYYKRLYQINSPNFRNDYAFSIAIHMLSGFYQNNFAGHLPGKMFYALDKDYLIDIKDNNMQFLVQHSAAAGQYIPVKTTGIDVHVMNKHSLLKVIDNE
jgi:hypothetical protein